MFCKGEIYHYLRSCLRLQKNKNRLKMPTNAN
jgi:hypothetical protein